jgi:hypothetical protein
MNDVAQEEQGVDVPEDAEAAAGAAGEEQLKPAAVAAKTVAKPGTDAAGIIEAKRRAANKGTKAKVCVFGLVYLSSSLENT